jgi:Flp pilus assembly protein TadG
MTSAGAPERASLLQYRSCLRLSLALGVRKFIEDARGAVAVLVALAAVPLIGTIGIGVDSARGYVAQSRLSAAVDAAALAGGNSFFASTRDDDIRMIFHANFPDGYLDASVSGPTITPDDANQKITVAASATVPVTFMRLFGHETVTVSASAEVTRKMKALEVVLSMDVSGSMGTKDPGQTITRLAASQQAAKELITILFGGDTSKDLLNIGLVPWSSKVNVMIDGQPFNSALNKTVAVPSFTAPDIDRVQSNVYYANNSPVPLLEPPPSGWKGCVFNRYINNATDDDDGDIRDGPFSGGGKDWPGWAPVLPGDYPNTTVTAKWGGEPVDGYVNGRPRRCALAPSGEECTPCPTVGITPLQNSKKVITDAVNKLAAGGNTNLPAGLGWAWRVLTPEAPFEHTITTEYTPDKTIVLMTDGENCAASGDAYKAVFGLCSSSAARDKMNARAEKLAANIKATGVIIYVVQFIDASSALKAFLKKVASGPDAPFYYYAPDASALRGAFHEIANHLSELRLSK